MAVRAQHKAAYRRMCAKLRQLREDAGMTQRDMAERLKMHNTMVHRSEIGDRRIDPIEFIAWCKACDVDPAKIIREL